MKHRKYYIISSQDRETKNKVFSQTKKPSQPVGQFSFFSLEVVDRRWEEIT